jgi:feruloyl esterase
VSANSTNLERFRARGGKLILWHGGTDAAISQNGTAAYYQRVVQASGGQAAADSFVEYFPAPGVNHCMGGAGADTVNLLPALENWVEKGIAPSSANLVAAKVDLKTGASLLARPLCKYPFYPRYKGAGDPASAASFTCVAP